MTRIVPDQIEEYIGSRLRLARTARDFTQGWLGRQVGFSAQQIYSYENANISIRAGKLVQLAWVLGYPINFFVEGLPDTISERESAAENDIPHYKLFSAETSKLISTYYSLKSPTHRAAVLNLIQELLG